MLTPPGVNVTLQEIELRLCLFAVSLDPPCGDLDVARPARLVMADVRVVDADHRRVGCFRSLCPIWHEAVELLPVQEIAERQGLTPNGAMAGAHSPEATS